MHHASGASAADSAMTQLEAPPVRLTAGVLALQGAFVEHIKLLKQASEELIASQRLGNNDGRHMQHGTVDQQQSHANSADPATNTPSFHFIEVRTPAELASCDALIIPGGESTSISLIAERTGLLEPLRDFVKVQRKPVWGTCAGLILLAEEANKSKSTGQELIGGLDVRVQRNYFGRQVESFEADLAMPFLGKGEPFHTVFIRAPVVEKVLTPAAPSESSAPASDPLLEEADERENTVLAPAKQGTKAKVEVLGRLPGRAKAIQDQTTTASDLGEDGDIVAVQQGNVFGTAFHPELTGDGRIHGWWLGEVIKAAAEKRQHAA